MKKVGSGKKKGGGEWAVGRILKHAIKMCSTVHYLEIQCYQEQWSVYSPIIKKI